jgi:hypothetical protein
VLPEQSYEKIMSEIKPEVPIKVVKVGPDVKTVKPDDFVYLAAGTGLNPINVEGRFYSINQEFEVWAINDGPFDREAYKKRKQERRKERDLLKKEELNRKKRSYLESGETAVQESNSGIIRPN